MGVSTLYFVVGELGNAGQERQMLYWIQAIKLKFPSIKIIVLVLNHTQLDEYDFKLNEAGAKVIRLATKANSLVQKIIYSRRHIKSSGKKTKVISFSLYCNFFVYLITLGIGVKALGALRSQYSYSYKKGGALRGLLNGFFPSTTISNNYIGKKELENWNLIFRLFKRVKYFSNRLDIDHFSPTQDKKLDDNKVHTLSVGTVEDRKRIWLIIEIIEDLNKVYNGRVIHTHAGIGPQLNELQELVKTKGLSKQFSFVGLIDNPVELYQRNQILIHMATSEGTPNVVMEAMATGLAVVATKAGDTPFVINSENGILIDIDDKESAKKELKRIIENKIYRENLGVNARTHMVTFYNKDKLIKDLKNLIFNE